MTVEQAAEVFWDGIFARLDNYNNNGGGGMDCQVVVDGFINGIDSRESWTYNEFCAKLEKDNGRKLNDSERKELGRGCIGLVTWALGITTNPSLMGGMRDFGKIKVLADAMKKEIDDHLDFYGEDTRVVIFGAMFQSDDPVAFLPDKDGIINVTDKELQEIDRQAGEDRLFNFDFGLYDWKTNKIYDATQKYPGMRVYENTIEQFDRSFGNRTIYFFRVTNSRLK
jgi:hypothetical protein